MVDGNGEEIDPKQFIVNYRGKPMSEVSMRLTKVQDVYRMLPNIKLLHWTRHYLNEIMSSTNDVTKLRRADAIYDRLEARLQELWDFPVDAKYVKFWYRPGCRCPRMDNDDAYPTG